MSQNNDYKPKLPVIWKGADGQARTNVEIEGVDAGELAAYGHQVVDVCGACRHFQQKHLGAQKPVVDKFVAAVLIEAEWKNPGFIGHRPEELGRCAMNAELATGPLSRACDQYSPDKGRIR